MNNVTLVGCVAVGQKNTIKFLWFGGCLKDIKMLRIE
jgi:virulence-associated protein VapD